MGVATEQDGGVEVLVVVLVVTTVVTAVVGVGTAAKMQEHALLSLEAGNAAVAGRSRLFLMAVTVVLRYGQYDWSYRLVLTSSTDVVVFVFVTVGRI